MRGIGSWIAGVALAVIAVGLGVALLSTSPFTRSLAVRYSMGGQAVGLSPQDTLDLVERVRVFVVRGDGELPVLVAGQPGFDVASIAHLEDVRSVLNSARVATLLLVIGVGLWIAATVRLGERTRVGVALKVGAAVSAVLVLLAAVAAALDFSAFFTAFHGVFFEAGTWTFPYDSLLIRLFPESFWVDAGMGWAALVLTIAGAYWIVGWRLAQEQ